MPVTQEALKSVMDHLLSSAKEEQKKDPSYQELFKHDDLKKLLDVTRHQMRKIASDALDVMKEKFNIIPNNDSYDMMLGLPLLGRLLREQIEKEEGFSCCEDKTRTLLASLMRATQEKE